ncbi:hypothetical protein F2P81_012910 [Scophthalmus maximus]|uniref:Uncharacterized protein n=1 Tax=Scophthalmus maximus TaxID=52904 RepID=A0A6A4SYR3_SCOMX|nr:hypothetical protein F2P81_012910 [Scophthalmus maximus]
MPCFGKLRTQPGSILRVVPCCPREARAREAWPRAGPAQSTGDEDDGFLSERVDQTLQQTVMSWGQGHKQMSCDMTLQANTRKLACGKTELAVAALRQQQRVVHTHTRNRSSAVRISSSLSPFVSDQGNTLCTPINKDSTLITAQRPKLHKYTNPSSIHPSPITLSLSTNRNPENPSQIEPSEK